LEEPKANWPKYYFDNQAYVIWAANEVYNYVLKRIDLTPMNAVRTISDIFHDYASMDREMKESTWIYRIAWETSNDIYNYLLNEIGEE
jgi:hypothetical protein